jgi:hypothetical protein
MIFRLGFGPMSTEIIDALCEYSSNKQRPLMLIASRNQVDAETGYVKTTPQLAEQLKKSNTSHLLICRDHCGPYFLDSEKNLSLHDAVEATKKTIAYDIEQGFDLIHIDTSRVDDTYGIAEELFKFCLSLNPNIEFEFGTEENVGVAAGAVKYKNDVAFAKNIPNIKFVVAQTGSLCFEDHQAGGFETDTVRELVQLANENGIGLKEHNADYLNREQIQLRRSVGVHALNIAPQLGVIQTMLLAKLADRYNLFTEYKDFARVVLASKKWSKWTTSLEDTQRIRVGGHYSFSTPEYAVLVEALNKHIDWNFEVGVEMFKIFDLYSENISNDFTV